MVFLSVTNIPCYVCLGLWGLEQKRFFLFREKMIGSFFFFTIYGIDLFL